MNNLNEKKYFPQGVIEDIHSEFGMLINGDIICLAVPATGAMTIGDRDAVNAKNAGRIVSAKPYCECRGVVEKYKDLSYKDVAAILSIEVVSVESLSQRERNKIISGMIAKIVEE